MVQGNRQGMPPVLNARRGRIPFIPDNYDELIERTLEERQRGLRAELDRWTGDVTLPVPPIPVGPLPTGPALPPATGAFGGRVRPVRRAWVVKYNPTRADHDRRIHSSDPFHEVDWHDPAAAVTDPWIGTWSGVMRGAGKWAPQMGLGDLVFVMRTVKRDGDPPPLAHRTLVGIWWVEAAADAPFASPSGAHIRWDREVFTFPARRFDFPVPIDATAAVDAEFARVAAFTDRTQKALLPLTEAEALAVARNCGLPKDVFTEPNPDQLVRHLAGLDLGPPQVVRRRITEGARAHAHRHSVEQAAVDVVVAACRRGKFGVVSTMSHRGLGSDLWANAVEADGNATELRIEVKGLSGNSPWRAHLTRAEVCAARRAVRDGNDGWLLVVVTLALNAARSDLWFNAQETVSIWHHDTGGGLYRADPDVGKAVLARR